MLLPALLPRFRQIRCVQPSTSRDHPRPRLAASLRVQELVRGHPERWPSARRQSSAPPYTAAYCAEKLYRLGEGIGPPGFRRPSDRRRGRRIRSRDRQEIECPPCAHTTVRGRRPPRSAHVSPPLGRRRPRPRRRRGWIPAAAPVPPSKLGVSGPVISVLRQSPSPAAPSSGSSGKWRWPARDAASGCPRPVRRFARRGRRTWCSAGSGRRHRTASGSPTSCATRRSNPSGGCRHTTYALQVSQANVSYP
jgi:hypothetical protein